MAKRLKEYQSAEFHPNTDQPLQPAIQPEKVSQQEVNDAFNRKDARKKWIYCRIKRRSETQP